jgi:hypothetical protein
VEVMAGEKLIRASDARKAILKINPKSAYCIDSVPAVDATPVVHGRWIETLVPDGYVQKASRMRKQCSVCGWTNACRYKYCPNCGAKMDLEVKNYG